MENQTNNAEISELLRDTPAHHAALISALFSANDNKILSLEDQLQQASYEASVTIKSQIFSLKVNCVANEDSLLCFY